MQSVASNPLIGGNPYTTFPYPQLARTPSPSPNPGSPTTTRSPSPLAFSQGHQIGSSNMTQHTIPAHLNTSNQSPNLTGRKSSLTKTSEPGSPLLRRALSPDRLHPHSAEKSVQRKGSLQEKKTNLYESL
ncbi:hypothetical protein FSP39_013643 [Pinctada imbricata]|uniref:Uncharacterized protein n=1 Tax=Pinctada imbricata TaxID=66713 RepID=A0AA88XR04_PINIB|nr:hypothetical protein FSP39_013643 [Pinctada imbricata]